MDALRIVIAIPASALTIASVGLAGVLIWAERSVASEDERKQANTSRLEILLAACIRLVVAAIFAAVASAALGPDHGWIQPAVTWIGLPLMGAPSPFSS